MYFIKVTKSNRLAYEKPVSAKYNIPGKAKRNGVSTAAFGASKQLIGRWLTNSLSATLKLPN